MLYAIWTWELWTWELGDTMDHMCTFVKLLVLVAFWSSVSSVIRSLRVWAWRTSTYRPCWTFISYDNIISWQSHRQHKCRTNTSARHLSLGISMFRVSHRSSSGCGFDPRLGLRDFFLRIWASCHSYIISWSKLYSVVVWRTISIMKGTSRDRS